MDELYTIARRSLLDALEALGAHRDATILVGAQAIYLHTGDADFGVAEYTTDADLAFDPTLLGETPPLESSLEAAGFRSSSGNVGIWRKRQKSSAWGEVEVQLDLLVPSTVSPGTGRRAARLPGHDVDAARKVDGLEGILVDVEEQDIASLEPIEDPRVVRAKVAGPGALLVAKMFKIHERRGSPRANDKDALDVLRILQAIATQDLAQRLMSILSDSRSATTGARAVDLFKELFGDRGSEGAIMAATAAHPLMDMDEVRRTCEVLASDLLEALRR